MLEFSSTESCTTSTTSSPLVGFSSNTSSCDSNVALMNDFESTEGCSGQGPQGPQGFSAYQIAVFDGFVGTEEQWLASLVGPVGPGVPVGGTAGQILSKINSTNYNTQWVNSPSLTGFVPYIGATQALNLGAFSLTANSIIKNGGTSSQYLMADGTTSLGFVLPTLTTGSVLFSNGSTIAQDNANFFWDNTNKRLGIGTITPTHGLNIYTTVADTGILLDSNTNPAFVIKRAGVERLRLTATGAIGTVNGLGNGLAFQTDNTERIRINVAGNVGIGTSTFVGSIKLAVNGQIGGPTYSSTYLDVSGAIPELRGNSGIGYYSSVGNHIFYGGSSVEYMRLTTAGLLGIGTNSPIGKLDVVGSLVTARVLTTGSLSLIGTDTSASAQTVFTISTGVNNATGPNIILAKARGQANEALATSDILGTIQFQGGNGSTLVESARIQSVAASGFSVSSRASSLLFYTTAIGSTTITERMRINSEGNVGIATTNPLEKLQVNGKILVNNGSLLYIDSNAGGSVFANSGAFPLTFNTNSADRMTILSNGNVGIGTTAPQHLLTVSKANATTSYDANANRFINVVNTDITDQNISMIGLSGYDTTSTLRKGAFIGAIYHDRTATSVPTDLILGTSGNGAVEQLVTQMRITTQGTVLIGVSSNANNKLDISDTVLAGSGALAGSVLNIAQTWNTTGIVTAIKLNVTDTLSGAGSLLLDLQVAGVSKFKVERTGLTTISTGAVIGGSTVVGYAGTMIYYSTQGSGTLKYSASGVWAFQDVFRLQLGGTTNSFPAIKRNGAAIDFRLADDSGFCNINAGQAVFTNTFVSILFSPSYYENTGVKQWLSVANTTAACNFKATSLFADVGTINASARVQIDSTTQGFLPPRMTTAQKVGIATPATGLVVFDTDLGKLCVFAVTWQTITSV